MNIFLAILFILCFISLFLLWNDNSEDYDIEYKLLISSFPIGYIIICLIIYFTLN